jgi:hypothetical protein
VSPVSVTAAGAAAFVVSQGQFNQIFPLYADVEPFCGVEK